MTIDSKDASGTPAQKVMPITLPPGEAAFEFPVPRGLQSVAFSLNARVTTLATGAKQELQAGATFSVNAIDATSNVFDVFFRRDARGFVVAVLGKSGEPVRMQDVKCVCVMLCCRV